MNQLKEILKEAARNGILGIVAYLLTEGVISTIVVGVVGERLDPSTVIAISAGIAWLLRGAEKQLHKAGSKYTLKF